jgi:hypothetical protein
MQVRHEIKETWPKSSYGQDQGLPISFERISIRFNDAGDPQVYACFGAVPFVLKQGVKSNKTKSNLLRQRPFFFTLIKVGY